ncbi:hypothetical protein GN157_15650 [Flavobacterium rakeshii]|uniref:Rhodopsin n=1 Tax=Flavobacterium rakeshii TaxID=1038845 RepID=A0A6N8HHC0_9FLAO|nr:hypothetical protein [Flavobacterium rakeshii]MEE1899896.1 hypothetical protein [Flavobacterium rakeshii]MUV05149.1 hypothetical protein [Flavobacterium rakeshii]
MRNNIWHHISTSFVIQYLIFGIVLIFIFYRRSAKIKYTNEYTAVKPFVWLMFIGGVYELVFTTILFVQTAFWHSLYGLLEFLVFNYLLYRILGKYTRMYVAFTILFLFFYISSLFYWSIDNHNQMEGYYAALETVFVMIWAVLWFKDLFKGDELISLWKIPAFYFVIGIILYLCGGVVPSLVTPYLFKVTGLWTKYWLVFLFLGTIMRVMMIIGLLKATVKKP